MNGFLALARIGTLCAVAVLAGCGDLTRSEAERILNGESRGDACVSHLDFKEDGFNRAVADGVSSSIARGLFGPSFKVADVSDAESWWARCEMGSCEVSRWYEGKGQSALCLPGNVEIVAIADAPFAPGSGSYKIVEFVEVVTLPPELGRIAPYVYTRYKKSAVFQKTDRGWRVTK